MKLLKFKLLRRINHNPRSCILYDADCLSDRISIDRVQGISHIRLYDLTGKLAAESETSEMETSALPPGLYTISVSYQNGELYHQKILKLR